MTGLIWQGADYSNLEMSALGMKGLNLLELSKVAKETDQFVVPKFFIIPEEYILNRSTPSSILRASLSKILRYRTSGSSPISVLPIILSDIPAISSDASKLKRDVILSLTSR